MPVIILLCIIAWVVWLFHAIYSGNVVEIGCWVWTTIALGMVLYEAENRRRFDPVGCMAWPWWLFRYVKRKWIERTAEYDARLAETKAKRERS